MKITTKILQMCKWKCQLFPPFQLENHLKYTIKRNKGHYLPHNHVFLSLPLLLAMVVLVVLLFLVLVLILVLALV